MAYGLLLYLLNLYVLAGAFFPWFMAARNWITLVGHSIFGGVLAYSLKLIQQAVARRSTWSETSPAACDFLPLRGAAPAVAPNSSRCISFFM